jgi:cytochrome oxidase assembly protein ShyY1
MWKLARTPRWIGALVFAFAVAAIFALLGQWQLARAVESGQTIVRETETVVPLESVEEPNSAVTSEGAGQKVTTSGQLVPGSGVILSGRFNGGVSGYWVVGELATSTGSGSGPSLAVALGWTDDADAAASAVSQLDDSTRTITGRYLTTEPPNEDDFENGEQKSASVSAFVNQWPVPPTSVYGGYVVTDDALYGLTAIDSPVPTTEVVLNWLNIFYAIEWVVFAGLAFFLWYRLLKDAYERQLEEAAELADVN